VHNSAISFGAVRDLSLEESSGFQSGANQRDVLLDIPNSQAGDAVSPIDGGNEPGTGREQVRIRFQSRCCPAGPEMTSYSAARIASNDPTSSGRAPTVCLEAGTSGRVEACSGRLANNVAAMR